MKLTLVLPMPTADLSPNARVNWRIKARAVNTARLTAKMEAINYLNENNLNNFDRPADFATVTRHFFFVDDKERDPENFDIRCKPYIDGLQDAGLIKNDSFKHIEFLISKAEKDPENPRVELEISLKWDII